jgi:E3 ubiquitin-protein ligase ZSWIM2
MSSLLQEVLETIESLQSNTILLLQRRGPTSFLVKSGDPGLKYTVQIGSKVTCSCRKHASAPEVCIHIIFVMIKILRVPPSNPIVWQVSLTGVASPPLDALTTCST